MHTIISEWMIKWNTMMRSELNRRMGKLQISSSNKELTTLP
jgi:hypothetical protein